MKKEIPILFSTPMVQAILDGRKTMTRRVVKFPLKCPTHQISIGDSDNPPPVSWSKWQPGDILWVRESYGIYDRPDTPVYKAGNDGWNDQARKEVKFKPSIHMPKEACRIWLEVTNVRVERLREINPNDACDEGVEYWNIDGDALEGGELQADFKNYTWTEKKEDDPNYEDRYFPTFANPVDSFRTLWQSINGPESWAANPWVWVVEFKVLSLSGRPEFKPSIIASPGEGAVVVEGFASSTDYANISNPPEIQLEPYKPEINYKCKSCGWLSSFDTECEVCGGSLINEAPLPESKLHLPSRGIDGHDDNQSMWDEFLMR